ncbi:hypothetical protein JTE90_017463 [Oedothorax gibbosus]|uniref:Uncharacterized protein n=1 Tax=Oedothorax gibbosus TaxID=931172 RepID=A0AAV6U270_9ARAC|nr:hypothetical protein JTE90_017463 [Oedothorax gibbosus]
MAFPLPKSAHVVIFLSLITCALAALSSNTTSTDKIKIGQKIPAPVLHRVLPNHASTLSKQMMDTPSLVEMIMFGLAGIPVYKAVGMLLPFFTGRRQHQKNSGRVLQRRQKRDLAYAQQLLDLLVTVEVALEKYGITEPQCQLRATCEIYRKNANGKKNVFEGNFIKLVNEMRREIENPKVVPLAKYVFEYYEEAAIRGETKCNCKEIYSRCPKSLSQFYKKAKGKKQPQRGNST